ncbi:pentatricopeptide repeat-containing protein At2g30100, chloroplastic [Aegilops tauschii subsp. strangulata]|uniref:Pentacotripeptide-repeat region of PRORP domain-containing protein n=3 Tax=Triticum aestivum TaxID=4565 RepID=A0A3B5ZUS7_WHEAT|nr:LOW QUALITY PROTEIN: pentatricopeptide repeat-containing protein At2g30100, chloroplastic [Aegilops tauschii subsp. strangulata]
MALSSRAAAFPHVSLPSPRPRPAAVSLRPPPPPRSVRLDHVIPADAAELGLAGGGLLAAAIEHLEREPAAAADDKAPLADLSPRELQLVLVYFAQEGRDAYCALEVFDWLRRADRVDGETMELMTAIACGWIERLVGAGGDVSDVSALLGEMDCVGLRPGFSLVEKAVALYWDRSERARAVEFVRDVLRRGGVAAGGEYDGERGGPVGYLAWKIMMDGDYRDAVKLVIEFKESGLKPEVYSYLIGLTALVKEQKEFSKALRKLNLSVKDGSIAKLDTESMHNIEKYQSKLLGDGVLLSNWAVQEGSSEVLGLVHERLLSLYTCAGCGLEAEHQLWELKLVGREPDTQLYDVVLAICASQGEAPAVRRLLAGVESTSAGRRKKSMSWLLRGYLKGGFYLDASETLLRMLDMGLSPDYLDRAAVLTALQRNIQESGNLESYMKLCKRLSETDLIAPCVLYLYVRKFKLWMMRML